MTTASISAEFKKQVTELLKPIADKAMRDHLKKEYLASVKNGKRTEEAVLKSLVSQVPTYRYKPADYPAEHELYLSACAEQFEHYGNDCIGEFNEFGFYHSMIDRMQWQLFLRGVQIVQAGALCKNQNKGA